MQSHFLPVTAVILALTACSSSAQQAPRQNGPDDVVATVGARKITLAELDRAALEQPVSNFGSLRLSQALYEARRAALDEMVGDVLIDLEAQGRKVDRAALVDDEIASHVTPVTDAEVAAWFQANQNRVQGRPLEQVSAPIRALLTQERTDAARRAYVDRLRAKTPVHLSLEPPRQRVSAAGRPMRGPATAPIEIIEFSDFQCPYCLRAAPTVRQVLSTYGDKVKLVYRHYPLPNHPNARPAAEAAACAGEQGKFWEFHDRLFANPTKLGPSDLKDHAIAIGLDATRFDSCVSTRKYKGDVDADLHDADEAGVNGTPAFFINGRPLSGAQPFESFKRIIDDELELSGR